LEKNDEKLVEFFSKDKQFTEAFKYLFENASDAIYILDKYGNFVAVNRKAEELTGFKREDFIGKSFRKIIPVKNLPKAIRGFLSVIREKPIRLELELKTATEKNVLVEVTSTPFISNGKIIGALGIVRDITERKKAEKVLQKSEKRFRTLMEEVPIGICNTDLKGKITYVNKRFEEATGYSRDEIVGKNSFNLGIMSDETLKLLAKRMKKRLMGTPSRLLEGRFKRKDGEWIWAEIEGKLIKKFGVPVGFQLTARDITERKTAEKERKRFEERLSALNFYGRSLNVAKNMEEIYRLTLDAMEKTLGFEIAFFMIVDKGMLCVVDHRGYPESFSIKLPLNGTKRGVSVKVARTGKPICVPDTEKEDDWVEFMPGIRSGLDVPIKIGSKVLGVIGVDSKKLDAFNEKDQELLEILASHAATAISNLDRAKNLEAYAREIQESQKKFERLFIDNPEAAVYMDSGFHILDINPRFCKLFGYSLYEVRGKHIDDVVVPKDKTEEAKILGEKFREGYVYHDTVRQRKDGTLVPVSMSGGPIIIEGKLIGTVGLYKDITEQKQMEKKLEEYSQHLEELVEKRTRQLKDAQEQLIKSERLAAIGQVAAMVGHDLRNPLTSIKGVAYYLKKKIGSKMDEASREMLELIENNVEHSNKIITDLMEYSKEIKLELTETTPRSIVNETLFLVEIPDDVQVRDLTQNEPKLKIDLEQIKRVFVNLIKNAVDAMLNGGKLTITSKESDGNVEITFTDTGTGMTKEVMEKIWTPFFTTKAKGMGLGLAICKRFIEAHGGSIRVESTVGEGTTFTVTIPIEPKLEGGEKVWVNLPESLSSTMTKA